MRSALLALSLGLAIAAPSGAWAESCWAYRNTCESVCTPDRVSRYYFGNEARCDASCDRRFSHCLRTGWWADLERRYSGGWESATPF